MIATVTFNPSLDRTMAFPTLDRGEVLAPAGLELRDRVAPLLEHLLQHRQHLRIAQLEMTEDL